MKPDITSALTQIPKRSSPSSPRLIQAYLALALIVPISTIGALTSLWIAPGVVGQRVVLICGLWMILFPAAWTLAVERRLPKPKLPNRNSVWLGALLGGLMFVIILASYGLLGKPLLNGSDILLQVRQIGFGNQTQFLLASFYGTFINSLVEEYLWRWFVYRNCVAISSKRTALWLSAFFFTIHHVLILLFYSHDWRIVGFGSLAVFIAGAIWTKCYQCYHSIWPGYISHAAADLALAIIAWDLVFRSL
jgi:uncharacterized protein